MAGRFILFVFIFAVVFASVVKWPWLLFMKTKEKESKAWDKSYDKMFPGKGEEKENE